MNRKATTRDIAVGCVAVGFALLALLVWIPVDIESGVIEVWRRSVRIGDAMLPVFSAVGILLAGAVIALRTSLRGRGEDAGVIDLRFVLCCLLIMGTGLGAMQVTGPAMVWLWSGGQTPYRLMLDTAPWKYAGFVTGGTVMTFGFMALAGHRVSGRLALLALAATVLIALLYDLPFGSLLLPPNGDM
ncbi:hypothetical protein [Antarctobacter sp.]|uniref:hypothetical protein n=1 Tax=Antarctobacter sp. TaxID=1872577 RepID=UPI002B276A20|nr:hypothetical protein [Antarctobacter sp.]